MFRKYSKISWSVILCVLVFAFGFGSLATTPKQQPAQDQDSERDKEAEKRARHQRLLEGMKELRKNGSTSLTQAEIDEFFESNGWPKNRPRFTNHPVCMPKTPDDICGAQDQWIVRLSHTLTEDRVKETVDRLLAQYGGRIVDARPTEGEAKKYAGDVILDLLTGAMFGLEASDAVAEMFSRDKDVRVVERSRLMIPIQKEEKPQKQNQSRNPAE